MNAKRTYETVVTPAFRVSFPSLFQPVEYPVGSGKKKYAVTMYFPKTTDMTAFKMAIEKVARGNFGADVDLKTLKLPKFRDGDKPTETGKIIKEAAGCWVLKASSEEKNGPIKVVRADNPKIECLPADIYSGCWARAVIAVGPFNHPVGGRGVTLYLNGVQKIKDDQPFSGRPRVEDVFDAVAETPVAPSSESTPW